METTVEAHFVESLVFGVGVSHAYRRAAALAAQPGAPGRAFAARLAMALDKEHALWRSRQGLCESGRPLSARGQGPLAAGWVAGVLCYLGVFRTLMHAWPAHDPQTPAAATAPALPGAGGRSEDLCRGSEYAAAFVAAAVEEALGVAARSAQAARRGAVVPAPAE